MATLYLTHAAFLKHDTGPGHPERIERMRAVEKVLSQEDFDGLTREDAPEADVAVIERVHPKKYIDAIRAAEPKEGYVHIDADTVMSPGSWEAALRAVGAGLRAVDQVMTGEVQNAFCGIRPCGHHAETARAMGFCLFNNIAIAAQYAKVAHDAERVAVVDFDVHHGNGTQDIFWSEKDLFFASTHQMPLFPGTGAVGETGVGNIFNAPLRSGDDGERFREAMETRILGPLQEFAPDIIFISAGFDAHVNDPLASLALVEKDFAWATQKIADIAHLRANGRIVSMLEGGYDLDGLAGSVDAHVRALMDAGA
ncbi:histone deacetylase-like amidohydrolase [bacterium MnTg02]|nr:histone deacetylase-like amidohydrolase [bacterium MnTg02]